MLRDVRTDAWYNVSVTLRRMRVTAELEALRQPYFPSGSAAQWVRCYHGRLPKLAATETPQPGLGSAARVAGRVEGLR
jgi:hypothetical protein